METIIYLLTALTGVSIVLSVLTLLKIKNINYLLEQPVIKKMSPELKLKPVKIGDDEDNKKNQNRNQNNAPQNRNNRPAMDKPAENSAEPRRDFNNRPDRNERLPRNDRNEGSTDRARNNNNDRFRDRDRNRDNRNGPDRNRNQRLDVFSNEKEAPVEENTNGHRPALVVEAAPAPIVNQSVSPLPARRPLPSAISQEEAKISISAPAAQEAAIFAQDDADIQHGRRNQLKKKPVFADVKMEEVEAKEGASV